jgi:hypothetical protein
VTVPESVPAKVPAKKRRDRHSAVPPPRYLTGDQSCWRFQMRLSPTFFGNGILAGSRLAGSAPIVRATLGPRRRGEAKRLALRLASLCQTICSFAADTWKGTPMFGRSEPVHLGEQGTNVFVRTLGIQQPAQTCH